MLGRHYVDNKVSTSRGSRISADSRALSNKAVVIVVVSIGNVVIRAYTAPICVYRHIRKLLPVCEVVLW